MDIAFPKAILTSWLNKKEHCTKNVLEKVKNKRELQVLFTTYYSIKVVFSWFTRMILKIRF